MNPNDCKEPAPHELARGVQPILGDTAPVEELHAHIRDNMKEGLTPTGYKFDCGPTEPTPGSSYNKFWDTGFAGEGDAYGIGEYTEQSANPDAVQPEIAA